MKISTVLIIFLSMITLACNKADKDKIAELVDDLPEEENTTEILPGTYEVACFYNKHASIQMTTDVWTKTRLTLDDNGTGTNAFELFGDAACTTSLFSGSVAVTEYENLIVDDVPVFRYIQDMGADGLLPIWFAFSYSGGNLYVDMDYTDSDSGPFFAEPTPSEIADFKANPASEGALMTLIAD